MFQFRGRDSERNVARVSAQLHALENELNCSRVDCDVVTILTFNDSQDERERTRLLRNFIHDR